MLQEYLDFEVQIIPLSESRYAVSACGPGGDASSALVLPTNDPTYQVLAERLRTFDTDEALLIELGETLFDAVFQGAIRDVYHRSQGMLEAEQGLRLRFNIAASERDVLALPWEFLSDPDQGPLALLDAPIMRYLPQSSRMPILHTSLPLKVLLTGAQTSAGVDVEHELAELVDALAQLGDHVQIVVEQHLTATKLQRRLRETFHVWHFVGESANSKDGRAGVLHFENQTGGIAPVSAQQLAVLLNGSDLRLAVINATQRERLATSMFSSLAPALVRSQVPTVVAMQTRAPGDAGRAFAGEFYRALAEGFPIDACVTEGRKAIMGVAGLDSADWGIPLVYTRAIDGRLFDLSPAPADEPVRPPTPAPPVPPVPVEPASATPPEQRTHNLPAMTTALIGRNQDVEAAQALIEMPDVRLLTLTGAGGTGKTRLAIQIAAELVDQFAHGVWFVNLAPAASGALVVPTIAHALGLKETGEQPLLTVLHEYVRPREMLLVLDNFEHVLDAAPLIATLLEVAPKLQVLVTSRAALRISGEFEFPVSPLALPNLRQLPPFEELRGNPAVALFADRARAVKATFALNEHNARAVAEICARLDGLPLAIELAAARCNVLTPQALVQRLTKRLDLLTGGARDRAARQQTLRGAIAWSYDLLDQAECTLFAQLALFVGGATLETIEGVCGQTITLAGGQPSALATLDGLASLVDKSLLRQIESGNGDARFVMLETIREYAQERLAERSDAHDLAAKHATYFLELAEQAEPELVAAEQATWLDRLESEHDNLRAALAWLLDQHAADMALRLASALVRFWWTRGYLSEGLDWTERALALPDAAASVRAKALNAVGVLAWAKSSYNTAQSYYEQALSITQAIGDQVLTAKLLNNLGRILDILGDYAQAIDCYNQSLAIYRQQQYQLGAARVLNSLGTATQALLDYEQAIIYYEESLALFRDVLHDKQSVAIVLSNLAHIALQQGRDDQALTYYSAGLAMRRSIGDKQGIAVCLEGLATIASRQGQPERAAHLWAAALMLREATGALLEPSERLDYDQAIAATEAVLGRSAWDAAWAAGRAMPLDQVLAEASVVDLIQ